MTDGTPKRLDRSAHLRWVPLSAMKISPVAQRDKLDPARVERIAREFDPDKFDAPKVNHRDGTHWVIDGWHRTEAAIVALGDDQSVQCWVRENLTDAEAAEWSLGLNDYRSWTVLDRFRLALTAGRSDETEIDRVIRAQGLVISRDKVPGGIGCVGTLLRIYHRSDSKTLGRTARLARDAYGDPGLEAAVLDGLGLLCQRYNGDLNDTVAVQKLANAHGGVNGLLGKAENLRRQTGNSRNHCVAAAAVEIINSGKGGKKLPGWWKQ